MAVNAYYAELRDYVQFGATEEATLAALQPRLEPYFAPIIDDFYDRIQAHSGAVKVITGGQPQIERLKGTLRQFLHKFFSGPWDDAYFDHRSQIGKRHVQVGLDQHYMVTALSGIREQLCRAAVAEARLAENSEAVPAQLSAINKLCDIELAVMLRTYREDTLRKLQTAERLSTFGELMSAICHELRNPLGVIESSSFLLRRKENRAAQLEHLDRIQRQVKRSTRIIGSMLDIVRESPVALRSVRPERLANRACEQFEEELGGRATLSVQPDLPAVLVDPDLVQHILGNLLQNALEAAPEGAAQVRLTVSADKGQVCFRVEDNGGGVPAEVRERLFDPLVTTKDTGVGLGLALCKKLARQLGAALALEDGGSLGGACFCLCVNSRRPTASEPPDP